jgi:hypothetical protein
LSGCFSRNWRNTSDPDSIEFLDKETFGGTRSRRRRESDLVVKVRFLDRKQVFFLIHLEHESSKRPGFPKRMYNYFMRFTEKYDLPVYPVVIFSYDTPISPAPAIYKVVFPDLTVLQFRYRVIQLNRIPWRRFVKQPNPVATALMTKMQIPVGDRPKVKAQCLRLLATLKLTPDNAELIYVFIDSYLELTSAENRIFERELARIAPDVKDDTTMEVISRWRREGREEGRSEGERIALFRMGSRRFGEPDTHTRESIEAISSTDKLNSLIDRLLEANSWEDLMQ